MRGFADLDFRVPAFTGRGSTVAVGEVAGDAGCPCQPEAEIFAHELCEHETRIDPDANARYGSFPLGTQNDLVNAMSLAVQREAKEPGIYRCSPLQQIRICCTWSRIILRLRLRKQQNGY